MKILFATMQFGRGYRQGTERYLSLLISGLRDLGHESVVLAGDPERRGEPLPIGTQFENEPRTLSYPSRGWMSVRGLAPRALAAVLRAEKPDLVHLVNPAHIGVGIVAAARQLGVPLVTTVVDFWWLCPKHTLHHWSGGMCDGNVKWTECVRCIAATHESRVLRGAVRLPLSSIVLPGFFAARALARGLPPAEWPRWRQRQPLLLEALNAAGGVIFLSRTAERLLRPRLQRPVCEFIQNGLGPQWFDGLADRPGRVALDRNTTGSGGARTLRLGYAGALARHKGVITLIRAVRRLAERGVACELWIASAGGDAGYESAIRRAAVGLNIRPCGRIPPVEMPAFYDALDAVVIPSLWPENLPNVASEAYARNVPVICSDVPGIAELVTDDSARFAPGDAAGLADAIVALAAQEEPPLLPSIPTQAEMTRRTLAFYERIRASG